MYTDGKPVHGVHADELHKAPPVTAEPGGVFAVHEEGGGVLSLYLTPFPTSIVSTLSEQLGLQGTLVDITPRWPDRPAERLAARYGITTPVDILHVPVDKPLPDRFPLMASPQGALPEGSDRLLGLTIHDPFHGVVYGRRTTVLQAALHAWISQRLRTVAPGAEAPDIVERTLLPLLEPVPANAWRQLDIERHRRFWTIDFTRLSINEQGAAQILDSLRWVGAPGGSWRDHWSW